MRFDRRALLMGGLCGLSAGCAAYPPSFYHNASLRELVEMHTSPFYAGSAVSARALRHDERYRDVLAWQYNLVTTENALKFRQTHPQRERYTFEEADRIVAFAERHAQAVRGHTLVWHQSLPDWLTDGNHTRQETLDILQEHIETVAGRYRGRLYAWDVVNEYFMGDGSLRTDNFWYKQIGADYIQHAFRWAHQADPDAQLFYNDYGNHEMNDKSDAIYAWLKQAQEEGLPVHGIGWQMHIRADQPLDLASMRENAERLRELGLELHITELDIRVELPASEEALIQQAQRYEEVFRFAAEECTAIVTWGFTDRYSWVPGFFEGYGAALPYDEDIQPKPAILRAMREPFLPRAL